MSQVLVRMLSRIGVGSFASKWNEDLAFCILKLGSHSRQHYSRKPFTSTLFQEAIHVDTIPWKPFTSPLFGEVIGMKAVHFSTIWRSRSYWAEVVRFYQKAICRTGLASPIDLLPSRSLFDSHEVLYWRLIAKIKKTQKQRGASDLQERSSESTKTRGSHSRQHYYRKPFTSTLFQEAIHVDTIPWKPFTSPLFGEVIGMKAVHFSTIWRIPYSKVRWCKCDPNKNADSDWEPSEETGSEDTDTSSEDKRTSDSQPSFGLTAGKWRSLGIEDDFGNADFGRVVSGVKQRFQSRWIRGNFPKPDEASQQFWSEQGALGTKSSFGHGEPANAFRSLASFETE
ncbi:hypothetical protein LXL04_028678 [Taraxacum kok-saghyz]